MTLKENWREILRKSWTIKWQAAAALLDAGQVIAPMFSDKLERGPFAGVLFFIALGGIVARLMPQPKDGL